MNNERRIYTLNGLPPEVVAVAFAKCSRSPEPFDEIAQELNEDTSRKFHEKWVVGYGHSSVAEHAVLSIALENVSILFTKVIEDNRLASYTEKSTRYQQFDKTRYYKPEKLMNSSLGPLYEKTVDYIFDTYTALLPKIREYVVANYPQEKNVSDGLYRVRVNNKVFDILRPMLPIASLTNLGMTINARQLEYAIIKLLSHPLQEMRDIGEEIKKAALKVTPTLVKYTDPNNYIIDTSTYFEEYTSETLSSVEHSNELGAVLVEFDEESEDKIIASLLYHFSALPYKAVKPVVEKMDQNEKEKIIDESLKRLEKYDRPVRELEQAYYTFDVLMDYGSFRDVQRHRMCTQINQRVTVDHGYIIPPEVKEAGIDAEYIECMEKAKEAYNKIAAQFPEEGAYAVPMAYNKRVLMTFNLRSLFHFIKLRSGKMGHPTYRAIAQQMYQEVKKVHPVLARYLQCDMS